MILTKIRQANPENIIAYIQGNLRYKLFYSNFAFLIRPHIREQIEARINSMDPECYNAGECKMCGCQTTHLQMANKACDKPCYPRMLNKLLWKKIKNNTINSDGLFWNLEKIKTKLNPNGIIKFYNLSKNAEMYDNLEEKITWYKPEQSKEKFFSNE